MDRPEPPYLDDAPTYRSAADRYDTLAYNAIVSLIGHENAVVWPEVEAKLADSPQAGAPKGIDPHHLTNARRRLVDEGMIEEVIGIARGGRNIGVYGPRDRRRRQTAFDRAAGRKRLLQTRYLGWSEASRDRPNLLGEGAEAVARASLRQAMASGVCQGIGGAMNDVHVLFGAEIPGGPLDAAAIFVVANPDDDSLLPITVLFEVKNLRGRIYPAADELFQLLDKAARLQVTHASKAFVPVLVCHRAHYLTFTMAKHIGGFVIEFNPGEWPQPLLPHSTVPFEAILEVQSGLGYRIERTSSQIPHLTRQFEIVLPRQAPFAARRWAEMAPQLAQHVHRLRDEDLSGTERDEAMDDFYRAACQVAMPDKPWRQRMSFPEAPTF